MKKFLLKLLFTSLAVMLISYFLPGVKVDNFWVALVAALVLGLLNVTLKPLLIILTIPFTIITLGLFLLAINAIIILIADKIVDGFYVSNFWWALVFSLVLSVLTAIFDAFGKEDK